MRPIAAAAAALLVHAAALADPISYQGVLTNDGLPATGTYDLQFDLYTDETPGGPDVIVATEILTDVPVTRGVFTVEIPFNPLAFNGDPRYLQVACRPHGAGAYTTLLPRQQVTDTPTAVHADVADTLALPATLTGATFAGAQALLEIDHTNINSGTAIRATSPWSGLISQAGDLSGAPVVAVAPVAINAIGQATGIAGNTGSGIGVLGAASTGTGGEFVATTTGTALHAHAVGTGNAGIFEIDDPANTSAALLARTPSTEPYAFAIHGILDVAGAGQYAAAVRGESRATNGATTGIGVWGSQEGLGWGVYGTSVTGVGVRGIANSGVGLYGASTDGYAIRGYTAGSGTVGFFETNEPTNPNPVILARTDSTQGDVYGVHAIIESTSPGGYSAGVRGENYGTGGGGIGVWGSQDGSGWGVYGSTSGAGRGVFGDATGLGGAGVYGLGYSGAYAGYFNGNVHVAGTLSKSAGSFKIDHPLDPAGKTLSHSFVESPDMKNIYDGVATLDADGRAEVTLPDYFEALNEDFRYQLTCLGGYAPVYIEREISASSFVIAGGKAGLRVSWQVTGTRHDAYAQQHPIVVEQDKPEGERGKYLNPEAFGKPAELGIGYAPRAD